MRAKVWTDGSCIGNPGYGGWAFLFRGESGAPDVQSSAPYLEGKATNQVMEMQAALEALKFAKEKGVTDLTIYTDSDYVKKGITDWIKTWKKNGWRNASGKPVKHKESWQEMDKLCHGINVKWEWVRAHTTRSNDDYCSENNVVDKLARKAALEARELLTGS